MNFDPNWFPPVPAQLRCCGLNLRTFTVGHEILLMKYGVTLEGAAGGDGPAATVGVQASACAGSDGRAATVGVQASACPLTHLYHDLLLAVLICAQDPVNADRHMHSWRQRLVLWLWSKVLLWLAKRGRFDLVAELDTFRDYRASALWSPDLKVSLKGSELVSPAPLRLLVSLQADFGLDEPQAFRTSMAWARAKYCALGEVRRELKFVTSADEDLFAAAEALNERAEREGLFDDPKIWGGN